LELEVLSKATMRALQDPLMVMFLAAGVYAALTFLTLPFTSILMLVLLCLRILDSLGAVQRETQDLVACGSAFWSLREMTQRAEAAREVKHGGSAPSLRHDIQLAGLGFAYDGTPVLSDAWLTVPAGQLTVITGSSGAGKTTVADLVVGLLEPQHGAVLIDAVSLTNVDMAQWRAMIGYVPQEMLLLHNSIAANVTLGDPALSPADAVAALEAAGASDFVASLPEGVHT